MAGVRDAVERLMGLFEGYSDAHGTYSADAPRAAEIGAKMEIKSTARTLREPVTIGLWRAHVAGKRPLGVIPVRVDDTCLWGVIDVDEYNLDLADLYERVLREKLPLVVCRSKSGGGHLFLFMSGPVLAEVLVARLREMAALIGHGTSEVFPKQVHVAVERGDLGNWLNMPYFDGDVTDRYGVKRGGGAMTLVEFVDVAERARITREHLTNTSFRRVKRAASENPALGDPSFGDGPPCLQHMANEGVSSMRNETLFGLATFAKRKYGPDWADMVERWNRELMVEPLPSGEVVSIIRSHVNKDYPHYKCREQPLAKHCNATLCRSRRFGVGSEDDHPTISGLSVMRTEPPLWFVTVRGERLELTTEELQSYGLFQRACMEHLLVCFRSLRNHEWLNLVAAAMRDVVEIEAPAEVGDSGEFGELLEEFLTNRHRGEAMGDLFLGRPVQDPATGTYFFRLRDLVRHLRNADFTVYGRNKIAARIRTLKGDRMFGVVNGKPLSYWYLPSELFDGLARPDTPEIQPDPM